MIAVLVEYTASVRLRLVIEVGNKIVPMRSESIGEEVVIA